MPYDFYTSSTYSIDFEALFKLMKKSSKRKFFYSNSYSKQYFTEWFHLLKQADQDFSITESSLDINLSGQNFQFPITYNKQKVYIHFSVSKLLNLLPKNYKEQTEFISTKYFFPPQQRLLWNPIDNFDKSIPTSENPIIAVEYLYDYSYFLIIDGNTRLTQWTRTKSSIPTLCITADTLVQNNLFPSEFDKLYYAFVYDMVKLANLHRTNDFSDKNLLDISFLTTNTLDPH